MDSLGQKASLEESQSFLGPAKQAPRKYTLDKGKAVDETVMGKIPSTTLSLALGIAEQAQKDLGSDLYHSRAPKIEPNPIKQKTEPSLKKFILSKGEVGESSNLVPTVAPPSRPPIVCKFCGQNFSTTQALGGHQNAHKQEREMQKVMKAAEELGKNPFMLNLLGIRPPFFPGSYYEYNFQNLSYALKEWQARSNSASVGLGSPSVGQTTEAVVVPMSTAYNSGWPNSLGQALGPNSASVGLGSPSVGQTTEGFVVPMSTAYNTGWPNSLGQALGSGSGSEGYNNFDAKFNMLLPAEKNEARPNKKQRTEKMGLDLSLKFNEPTGKENSEKQNESTEVDLTLKL